jgi:hypothetical protein
MVDEKKKTSEMPMSDDPPLTNVWLVMHLDPSISAAFLALDHHSQATRYSRPKPLPTRAVMYNYVIRCLISLISQCREILDGIEWISRRLVEQQDSEMTDLRASEYLAASVHYDSALTHTKRSLKN